MISHSFPVCVEATATLNDNPAGFRVLGIFSPTGCRIWLWRTLITWISRFIEKYGTHIVVGVKMGGKDVIHIKQLQNSNLQPTEVQKLLKRLADERFSEDVNDSSIPGPNTLAAKLKVYRDLDSYSKVDYVLVLKYSSHPS